MGECGSDSGQGLVYPCMVDGSHRKAKGRQPTNPEAIQSSNAKAPEVGTVQFRQSAFWLSHRGEIVLARQQRRYSRECVDPPEHERGPVSAGLQEVRTIDTSGEN